MATEPDAPIPPPVEFDDWENREAARRINALFANQVFVQPVGDGMLRINFGQVLTDEEPSYHSAVVISGQNAVAFGELIYRYGRILTAPPQPSAFPPGSPVPSAGSDNG